MAEMIQELQERDRQLLFFQEQNQSLKNLNSELSGLLNLLPDTEELKQERTEKPLLKISLKIQTMITLVN